MSANSFFQVQQWIFFLIFIFYVDYLTPFSFLELAISRNSKKEVSIYMFQETKKKKKKKVVRKLQGLKVKFKVTQSHPTLIPWTAVCLAPLSIGFSRQEYWTGLPFPFPVSDTLIKRSWTQPYRVPHPHLWWGGNSHTDDNEQWCWGKWKVMFLCPYLLIYGYSLV